MNPWPPVSLLAALPTAPPIPENIFKKRQNTQYRRLEAGDMWQETWERRRETGDVDRRCETGDVRQETWDVRQETWDKRLGTGDMRQETWERRRETGDVRLEIWDRRHETWDMIQDTRHTRQKTWYRRHDTKYIIQRLHRRDILQETGAILSGINHTPFWHTKFSNRNVCDRPQRKSVLN